ncbi:SHOC1 protein, partial [Rhinopomastus cyanomelas]|nr:SHOC1 protein [Rhinopomastus cyanomelas]
LLFRKPIFSVEFHVNNELVEVIPSSNTSSQIDKEELFSLTKNVLKEESTQDKYLKIDYATEFKKQCQDLCMEEEFIFVDSLENLRKKLPSSCVLLSRLQFFLVKDPLLDSKGQNLTEDNIFRACLTFQKEMKTEESKRELQEIKENFCTICVKDEEVSCCFLQNMYFTLPFELGFGKTSNSRSDSVKVPSYVELKGLLNLAPETMADEDMCKEMIKADLKAEITYKLEISKYCPIPQEICCSSSRSMLEFCESDEMELPLTPLDRQQKARVNSLCAGLKEEPIPLASNSILITEPSMEYLEFLVWQSEKYEDKTNSLLFVEHQTVKLAYQRCSLTELMEILPVEVEEPKLSSLEEGWWFHLGLNPVSTETLEQLSIAVSNTNNLLPTVAETFTQFTSYQLKKLLSAEIHQADKVIHPRTALKIQRQNLPMNAASSAKNDSTDKSVEELTGGTIIKNKLEEAVYFLSQENKTSKSSESVNCKDMFSKQDNSDSSLKAASFVLATKWDSDGSDLNNFIILRSKQTLTLREAKNNVDIPEKEHRMHAHKEDSSVCETLRTEEEEPENEDSVTVSVQASESHCQAYCLLEEATTPVLTDLTNLSVLASVNWSFDSIKFDHTRFFLKQQEKVICDHFKEGKVDEKDIMLFRYAALVHLLVTVRDLLLTCGLDTALGYLSKAKDIYKSVLEPCLNNVWRQFMIVQYSSQKKHETNSKIMELQRQILKRMQSYGKEQNFKVLIITRMDSEREKTALIHTLSGVQGLKAMDLNSKKKGTLLGCKDVISNRYSCIIVHNQQIGADFPWAHFSLVMEYDYSENSCWKKLCKNLNVTYMTFKTAIPETSQMWDHRGSFLLAVEIPYVFLTTEGLLNTPDSLQLLESKYSITFVERSSSYSLKLFGSADRYVVLTIDECTAVFLQSLEELNCENSCDNVTSKLMALSLQYTCCWIVFYSRERLSSEYGLRGDTLLNLVTIYATLIELTQKSEDFDVKVLLTPGIDETGVVIRLIADNILIASSVSPHEWLDRSWLSVLPSEAEKFLLTFPCINPLAAQCMLKKGSSLNSLLFASFNQLQELLPEVPEKILKHFSDMTSSCSQNAAARLEASVKGSSPPENQNSF